MKRRLAALAAMLALALSLSGCEMVDQRTAPTPSAVSGYLIPTELSESEMGLLDLFGTDADGWQLYDFLAPEGTQYTAFTLWQLEEGEWQELSHSTAATAMGDGQGGYGGRIAVHFDHETLSFEYACQFANGTVRHDPLILGGDRGEDFAWGCSTLADEAAAEPDTPMALMLISATRGNSHTQYIPQIGFDEPELFDGSHVYDYALTVEFRSTQSDSHAAG